MKFLITILSVSLGAILTSAPSFSRADVTSDFSVTINKTFLANQVLRGNKTLEINEALPAGIWNLSLPIQIRAGQVQLKTNLNNLNFDLMDNLLAGFSGLSFSLALNEFGIDTVVMHNVGGVMISVKVQTNCRNLNLSYDSNGINIDGAFKIGSSGEKLTVAASALNLNLKPEVWRLSSFECDNIQGVEQAIASQIQGALLNSPENLQKVVIEYLNGAGTRAINNALSSGLDKVSGLSEAFQVKLTQSVTSLDTMGEFIKMRLHAKLISKMTGNYLLGDDPNLNITGVAVFFPKGFMETLLQESISQQLENTRLTTNDVSALKNLMSSRLLQFLVWPALLQLPKKSVLSLRPYLQKTEVNIFDVDGQTVEIKLKSDFGVWVSTDMPMVYLGSPLNLSGVVSSAGLDAVTMSSLNIKKHWHQDYLDRYNPTTFIATSFFSNGLQSLIKKKLQTFSWPISKNNQMGNLEFSGAKLNGMTLGIYYQ